MSRMALQKTNLDRVTLAIILSVAAIMTFEYYYRVDEPGLNARLDLHLQIMEGRAESPYRYRILVPLFSELLIKASTWFWPDVPTQSLFLNAYLVYDFLAIALLLLSMYLYLRAWFTADQSLIGVLFMAATMPIMMRDHFFQPWSLLEPGLFSLALLAALQDRFLSFGGLLAVATLNRETAVFLIPAFLFAKVSEKLSITASDGAVIISTDASRRGIGYRQILFMSGCYLALWLIVYLGLRHSLGNAAHIHNPFDLFAQNFSTETAPIALRHNLIFFGAFWVFAILGWLYAPRFVRGTAFIAPIYYTFILFWSRIYEVRLLMTLYPIIIPLGLSFIYLRPKRVSLASEETAAAHALQIPSGQSVPTPPVASDPPAST